MEPSDESSGSRAADVLIEELQQDPSRKRKVANSSGADADDAVMEEPQDGTSPKKVNIDRAVDLMRFVFREGMPFLDNGSGRCFAERMLVDMSGFMVNMMFQDPTISQQNGPPRMWTITPTLDKDIAHAFAKEARKGIANEFQGDLFGIVADVCSIPSTCKYYLVLFVRYVNGKGEVLERLLGIVPDPDENDLALKVGVDQMLSEAGLKLSNVRGQGYGLTRCRDAIITELKTSVAKASATGYCVYPCAFQLHSILVPASQNVVETFQLFQAIDALSNLIQGSPQFNEKVRSLIQEELFYGAPY